MTIACCAASSSTATSTMKQPDWHLPPRSVTTCLADWQRVTAFSWLTRSNTNIPSHVAEALRRPNCVVRRDKESRLEHQNFTCAVDKKSVHWQMAGWTAGKSPSNSTTIEAQTSIWLERILPPCHVYDPLGARGGGSPHRKVPPPHYLLHLVVGWDERQWKESKRERENDTQTWRSSTV